MNSIVVEDVSLHIGKAHILDQVSAVFQPGEISGIVGRNGSGKSMLFKCICGFIKPSSGKIIIGNTDYHKTRAFPRSMGFIIEAPGFLPDCSALDNLIRLASINGRAQINQLKEWIETVGLDPLDRKKVGKFSLGMKQRLGIAQAIMENPDYLILDEPFNGLDNTGVEDIRTLLLNLKNQGKTILLSSHNPLDITLLCDRVYEMDHGKMSPVEGKA